MRKINRLFQYALSFPKTLYFNIRTLPFKVALKLPIFVYFDVKLGELHKGIINIDAPLRPFMIKFGVGGVDGIDSMKSQLWLQKGSVVFKGQASFAKGCSIRNNGNLSFGDNFGAGKNCFISCTDSISFGNDIMMAWGGTIRDSDGHTICYGGIPQLSSKPVSIGNHVWLAANTTILKGVTIMDNCVVAYGSLVTKTIEEEGILMGGVPAKKLRDNISWIK